MDGNLAFCGALVASRLTDTLYLLYLSSISFNTVDYVQPHSEFSRFVVRVQPEPSTKWYAQKVDHFDHSNAKTFQQKYYVNDTFWDKKGPVFVNLGGEGPLTIHFVNGHFILNQWAKEFNALVVAVEHRFYGDSNPKDSLSVENLKLLTSQQALWSTWLSAGHRQCTGVPQLRHRTRSGATA